MAYIGNDLRSNEDYKIIDDISSGFNGSATSFALQVGGATPVPFPKFEQQLLISVNGVIQEPDPTGSAGFKLSGTNIVFSSAPTNGHAFFGVIYAGADYVNAGGTFPDGSINFPSITFSADTNTGFTRTASGTVALISDGTKVAQFPTSQGSSGQALITDGGGNLSFGVPTAAFTDITLADSIIHSGDSDTKIRFSGADQLKIETAGTERVHIDGVEAVFNETGVNTDFRIEGDNNTNLFKVDASSDRIGIGIAAPTRILQIKSAGVNATQIGLVDANSTNEVFRVGQQSDGDGFLQVLTDSGTVGSQLEASGDTFFNGGNVGIGLSNPTKVLHVTGTSSPEILLQPSDASPGLFIADSNRTGDGQHLAEFGARWNGTKVARIVMQAGDDTTNKDNGQLVFYTSATGTVSERLRINEGGDVGINESSPSARLHVNGGGGLFVERSAGTSVAGFKQSGGSAMNIYFQNSGSTNHPSIGSNNEDLTLGTGNNERLRIDSNGDVLIGRSDTTGIPASGNDLVVSKSGNMGITIQSTDSSYSNLYYADSAGGNPSGYISYQHSTDSLQFATATSERMRIDSSGKVGIGESSPATILHLRGTDTAYGGVGNSTTASGAKIRVQDTAGRVIEIVSPGTNAEAGIGSITNHNFTIFTSNTERVRFHSGNISDPAMCLGRTDQTVNSSNFGHALFYDGAVGHFRDITGANTVLRAGGNQGQANIFGDGDITNNNNSYGQASDETLKQDIVDAASQWNDIKGLRVRKFRFKDNPTGVLQIGVIAQEIETVSAGLVQENEEGIKSVKYSVLYMKAVKCLQEAIAKIETLETKVAALEAA